MTANLPNLNALGAAALTGYGATLPAMRSVIPGSRPRISDIFTRPYVNNPVRQTIADTAAGAGAGVGVNAAQTYFPDQPWMQLPMALAGGTN